MFRRGYIKIVLILVLLSVAWLWRGEEHPLRASMPSLQASAPYTIIQSRRWLIQSLVDAVSQGNLYRTIRDLQDDDAIPGWDALRSRYAFSHELAIERDYIRKHMEEVGLIVREHSFTFKGTTQINLEGTLAGRGPDRDIVYILCAHYDSLSETPFRAAPGANDNASGVAGMLEAARILSQYRFQHTLRFVAFAAEEEHLAGSDRYAQAERMAGTKIGGVINLDMIAWNNKNRNVIEIYTNPNRSSEALGKALVEAIYTYHIALVPRYDGNKMPTYSDHFSFWLRNYPAILVTDDTSERNPYYHTVNDTLDKLDLSYARKFVQAVVATLAEQAEIIPEHLNIEHDGLATAMFDPFQYGGLYAQ